jgi:branched-chain amino acid transport system ATP-binding protein
MSIQLDSICAGYVPDVLVIEGVSLDVPDQRIVTILGPNGSGKSTLLKAAMGFVPCRSGRVVVDGEDVSRVPVHQRAMRHGVAFVPQLNNVFGPLTVRENLELGGARLSRADRRVRTKQLLDHYPELAARASAKGDSLSGGERQMLALARALMTRPRYLLLDEPSAGLSPLMLSNMFAALVKVRDREQVTVLVVEQNAAQSLAVSERGLVLAMGKVAIEARAQELLDDPQVSELYLGGVKAKVATGDRKEGARA